LSYKTDRSALHDPAIQLGARSFLPVDWAQIPRLSKQGDIRFRARPRDDRQGLTIPIRGPANGIWALLLVTSNENDAEWAAGRPERTTDLVHVGQYVHQRACELHAPDAPIDLNAITRRESEALERAAEGKTAEDIAILMRISAETVKAHLDSARYKLGALTRAHAVAKAIRAGLVH
jgi:DNA-binding CsgD family transcriptional regulator